MPPRTVGPHRTWCNDPSSRAADINALRKGTAPVAKSLALRLPKNMVLPTSSRVRLWMRWDTVILSLKRRKRRDAIGSVGMPVWIDHNKTRAASSMPGMASGKRCHHS